MKAYSLDLRQKIIDTYSEGGISQRQLAKRFRVALSFIEKLLKQYRETGSIAPKVRRQQTPTKLSQEQLNILSSIVSNNNDATLDELRIILEKQTGVLIGRSTLDRMLKRLNLNLKKKTLHPTEKETERVQLLRFEFWRHLEGIKAENLIFIDESGVNLSLIRLFARALKGKRARSERPMKRGKNVSLIGAMLCASLRLSL